MTTQRQTAEVTLNGITATVLIRGALEHVADFDALTPAGAGFAAPASSWVSRYRPVDKRRSTAAWKKLYAALLARNPEAIVAAAKRLPSVCVELDTRHPDNPNFGFVVIWRGWRLFEAPIMSAR